MTASVINLEYCHLIDNFPGFPASNIDAPADGIVGTGHFNVTVPKYRAGTKVCLWDAVVEAWITFIYLQNAKATTNASTAIGTPCCPDSTTYWKVCQDPDTTAVAGSYNYPSGMIAIPLGVIADDSYGFFWCGGPCPEDTVMPINLAAATVTTLKAYDVQTAQNDTATGYACQLSDGTDVVQLTTSASPYVPAVVVTWADE